MKHNLKRRLNKNIFHIIFLSLCLIFLFVGCAEKKENQTGEIENSTGAYEQVKIGKIKTGGLNIYNILRFKQTESNQYILMLPDNESHSNNVRIYLSNDNGISWEKSGEIKLKEKDEITDTAINDNMWITSADYSEGKYMICADQMNDEYTEKLGTRILIFNEKMNVIKNVYMDMTNDEELLKSLVSAEIFGDRLYLNYGEKIEIYQPDYAADKETLGDKVGCIEMSQRIIDSEYTEDKIYIVTATDICEYDPNGIIIKKYDIGKLQDSLDVINDDFSYGQQRRDMLISDRDGNLFLLLHEGIFKYYINQDVLENIVSNQDNVFAFGVPEGFIQNGNSFYVLSKNVDTNEIEAVGFFCDEVKTEFIIDVADDKVVLNEADDEDVEVKEIKVYSLHEKTYFKKCVDTFNRNHKDIHADYVAGIEEDSNIGVQDAINALNTSIYAGTGPDVIFMDGLDIEKYADEGLLCDVSDIEKDHEEDALTNITKTFYKDDMCYAIPTRFSVYMIFGNKDSIEDIHDIKELTAYVDSSKSGVNYLFIHDSTFLYNTTYPFYEKEMLKNGINQDAVKEFFEDSSALYMATSKFNNEFDQLLYDDRTNQFDSFSGMNLFPQFNNKIDKEIKDWPDVTAGELFSISGVWQLYTAENLMKERFNKEYDFRIFGKNTDIYYVPRMIGSVNSRSKEMNAAKIFLSECLDADIQSYESTDYVLESFSGYLRSGIPVSSVGREKIYNMYANVTYSCSPRFGIGFWERFQATTDLTDEQKEHFEEIFRSADTPIIRSEKTDEILMSGLDAIIYDHKTPAEATDEVMEKLEILVNE